MDRIIYCLTVEHDLRLVVVAGLVSLLSGAVGYDLLARAHAERRLLWISAAAFVTGSGIWATHFIAILAYDPGVALGFGLVTTAQAAILTMFGGAGALWGPVIGAVILTAIEQATRSMFGGTGRGTDLIIYASLIIGIAVFYPGGVVGWWTNIEKRWRHSPNDRKHP